LSELEYLTLEEASSEKHEYRAGEMYAMSAGSSNHARIQVALIRHLDTKLDGKNCEVFSSDTRVKIAESRLYAYPDVSVVCGKPEFTDPKSGTLLNPTVIVEILSPSTEAYDRGIKFLSYRACRTLRQYMLVSSTNILVEIFTRTVAIRGT
jgi:Uma2 family endonuclease